MPRRAPRRHSRTRETPRPVLRTGGRPPAIASEHVVNRLLEALSAGVDVASACYYAGLSTSAHGRAMDLGRQAQDQYDREDNPQPLTDRQETYRVYREAVDRARAQVTVVNVALIANAAAGGAVVSESTETWEDDEGREHTKTEKVLARPVWQAARFLVQTGAARDAYVTQQRRAVELTGAGGGPVRVDQSAELIQGVLTRLDQVAAQQAHELPGGWSKAEGSIYGDDPEHEVIDADVEDGDEVAQYGDDDGV